MVRGAAAAAQAPRGAAARRAVPAAASFCSEPPSEQGLGRAICDLWSLAHAVGCSTCTPLRPCGYDAHVDRRRPYTHVSRAHCNARRWSGERGQRLLASDVVHHRLRGQQTLVDGSCSRAQVCGRRRSTPAAASGTGALRVRGSTSTAASSAAARVQPLTLMPHLLQPEARRPAHRPQERGAPCSVSQRERHAGRAAGGQPRAPRRARRRLLALECGAEQHDRHISSPSAGSPTSLQLRYSHRPSAGLVPAPRTPLLLAACATDKRHP